MHTFAPLGSALPSQAQLVTLAVAVVGIVAFLVKQLEPFIEALIRSKAGPIHDATLRMVAVAASFGFILLGAYQPDWFNLAVVAFGVSAGSVGGYTFLTNRGTPDPVPVTPVDLPVAPLVTATPADVPVVAAQT